MNTKAIIEQVEEYLKSVAQEADVTIADVELVKEGPNLYLRIFIDKEEGVTIADCENVSRKIESILDEKDPIVNPYILEVSSPGIDRPLKKDSDYIKYKGHLVDLKLYKAVDKQKEFQGNLVGLQDNKIIITIEDSELKFDRADVAICRLAVVF